MNESAFGRHRALARVTRPSPARLASGAAFALFAALALFGARVHWVEEAGTAERDGYVAQAEQILAGELPHDPFRPLLYPTLTAALSVFWGSPFAAARLISNASAALLAWLAWRTGRELGGTRVGAWAFALVAVNPNVWIVGQHVSTDLTFAALAAGVLSALATLFKRPTAAAAITAGALFGLAAFTRGNALFLLPGVALTFVFAPAPWRTRTRGLALFAIAALPGFIAHWTTRALAFGSPWYDENWKNLAWKLYARGDWSYLDHVPFRSAREIVRADPGRVLLGMGDELSRFAKSGLAQLAGTWAHAFAFGLGAVVAAFRPKRRNWAALGLLASFAAFLLALAFAFFTWGRLLLGFLPTIAAISCLPLAETPRAEKPRLGRLAALTPVVFALLVALLVATLAAKTFLFRLPAFGARHPYGEIAALREVQTTIQPERSLAGTSPFLGRYLDRRYVALPDAFGPEVTNPTLWFARVEPLLRAERVEFLAVSEIDLRDRPSSLLEGTSTEPPTPWLSAVETAAQATARPQARVVLWRVLPPNPPREAP